MADADGLNEFDIGIVVMVRGAGVDYEDAIDRAHAVVANSIQRTMITNYRLVNARQHEDSRDEVTVMALRELQQAISNGYVTVRLSSRAADFRGLPTV